MRHAACALMVLLGLAGVACFVMLAGAETPYTRALDAGLFLLDAFTLVGVSYVLWPRGAR